MRYGKYLIVTLPDFRRHFDFRQFLNNRRQFVRDMHPDKVYYWGDTRLLNAYHVISNWISGNHHIGPDNIPGYIIENLKCLVGDNFSLEDIKNTETKNVKLTDDIILLIPGQELSLPVYDNSYQPEDLIINLHKIAVTEGDTAPSIVRIGESSRELLTGDALYVTECGGNFIDFTPNHAENEYLTGQLIDSPGHLGSLLVITDKFNGIKQSINGVISFILVDHGYIYINESGRPISIENYVPMTLLRMEGKQAIQIKSEKGTIRVLYREGICRSTDSMSPTAGIRKI